MGIETYGGACPCCKKAMIQKWESMGGFQFDACTWCGYAIGEVDEVGVTTEYIWDTLYNRFNVTDRKGVHEAHEVYEKLPEYMTAEESDFYPSVFDYTKNPRKTLF